MNIGWQEMFLLMIFALIVFGPKRLPEIGRQVGRFVAEARRMSREFKQEVRDSVEPLEREVREAERAAREAYDLDPDHSTFRTPPTDG
jgi:Tat protein translocase TatB subunit